MLSNDAVRLFRTKLLPLTTILTLKVSDAIALLDSAGFPHSPDVRQLDGLIELAKSVHTLGCEYVLLHLDREPVAARFEEPKSGANEQAVTYILYDGTEATLIKTAHVATSTPQGAGRALACTSSSPNPPPPQYNKYPE